MERHTLFALVLTFLIIVCTSLYLWLFRDQLRKLRYYQGRYGIKGHKFVPFLGYLPQFAHMKGTRGDVEVWHQYVQQYGPVSYMFLGPQFRIVCTDASMLKDILVTNNDKFRKPKWIRELMFPILRDGLVLSEGATWKRHRSLLSPAFHFNKLQHFLPLMDTAANNACVRLVSTAGDATEPVTIEMHQELAATTLEIIGKAAFGSDLTDDAAQIYVDLNKLLDTALDNVLSFTAFLPYYQWFPTPGNIQMWRRLASMRRVATNIIAQRRAQRDSLSSEARNNTVNSVLLDFMLDACGEGQGKLTDQEVYDEVMTFIMAGHETTNQTLSWTLILLCKHPEWKARLQAEVASVMASGAPLAGALPQLQELHWVLLECLRLYPPAPLIFRESNATVELSDITLLPDTIVVFPTVSLHRSTAYWKDPELFNPERWRDGIKGACSSTHAFCPFGEGPRSCIGMNFALQEAKVILFRLLYQLDFELDPTYKHFPVEKVTLRPGAGLPMKVWRRTHDASTQ